MCWNILKTQHSLCPASPSSRRVPRNAWCPGTPDCNNWRSPSPARPSGHLLPPPHGLRLASLWPGWSASASGEAHVPLEAQKMPPTSSEWVAPHDPCQLRVSRSWAWGWHETWPETLLPSLPFREPESRVFRGCLAFHEIVVLDTERRLYWRGKYILKRRQCGRWVVGPRGARASAQEWDKLAWGPRARGIQAQPGRQAPAPALAAAVAAQACPWLTAAPGAQCWPHSYLWWREKGVPARWPCSQKGGGQAGWLVGPTFPSPGSCLPSLSQVPTPPHPQPSLSASNKGDHCPLQEYLHSQAAWLGPHEAP